MGTVGVGVHEGLAALIHSAGDLIAYANAAKREIAGSNRLGELYQVGFDTPVFQTKHFACTTETGDHLVGNQQHLVLIADFPDTRKIVVLRYYHATSALDRFGNEHGDRLGAGLLDCFFQFVCRVDTAVLAVKIGIGARNVNEAWHAWFEHRPVGVDAGGAHRRQGDAMIAPDARYDFGFLRLAFQLPVIACHLDVTVRRFASARGEVEVVNVRVSDIGKAFGQFDGAWI